MRATFAVAGVCLSLVARISSPADAAQSGELGEALGVKPDRARGQLLYETCAACHQADGGGVADGGIPAIAGQHYPVIVKQLADFRSKGREELRMEAFAARHWLEGAQAVADVAAYVASLPRRPTRNFGDGRALTAGGQAYARACAHCHGTSGDGDGRLLVPRLAAQHYEFLLAQMNALADGTRANVDPEHGRILNGLTADERHGTADHLSRLREE
jgi:cytochrome c553